MSSEPVAYVVARLQSERDDAVALLRDVIREGGANSLVAGRAIVAFIDRVDRAESRQQPEKNSPQGGLTTTPGGCILLLLATKGTPMRLALNNLPPKMMTPARADELAATMTASERAAGGEWTYRANHDPKGTGWSFVEVFDETGEWLGALS